MSFVSLGVPAELVDALARAGVEEPFPIQAATLPDTLNGRDVLGRGRTGSGKTLAFSLPLVARLASLVDSSAGIRRRTRPGSPRGLVLAPTRELANQILTTIQPLAAAAGLSVMTIYGGVSQVGQVKRLRRATDIVVATPGRLEDLMRQGEVLLDDVAVSILDEADHMADLGFLPGVTRILEATPEGGQRLLFSATLDNDVDALVKKFLDRPLVHSVDSAESPVDAMTHHVFLVGDMTEKRKVVRELASGEHRRLLFTRTKHHARRLAQELTENGIPAVEMHGNLSQNARERGLKAFANGSVRVMVATDVAARGIHVDDIDLVVHVDPPAEHKAYLHRSGRTARAGRTGDVVTLVLPSQRRDFRSIARAAKITAEPARVSSGDDAVVDLVGTPAAPVSPDHAPVEAAGSTNTAPQRKPKQRRSRPDTAPTGRRRSRPATPRGDWSERRRDGRERSEERRGERVRRDVADRERGEREYGDRTSSPSRRTYSPDEQAGTRKPRHAAGKKQGTGKGKGYRHSDASDQRFSKGGRSASGRSGSTPRQGRQGRRDGGRGTYAAA